MHYNILWYDVQLPVHISRPVFWERSMALLLTVPGINKKDKKQYMYNLQQNFECRGCLEEQYILQLVPFWQRERANDSWQNAMLSVCCAP